MWVMLFALATAASVWFSAANLAIQLRNAQATVNSALESRERTPEAPDPWPWSAEAKNRTSLVSQLE